MQPACFSLSIKHIHISPVLNVNNYREITFYQSHAFFFRPGHVLYFLAKIVGILKDLRHEVVVITIL